MKKNDKQSFDGFKGSDPISEIGDLFMWVVRNIRKGESGSIFIKKKSVIATGALKD